MIKVGVVGVGNMGRHHARVYYELSKEGHGVKLVGVVDKDLARARAVAEAYGTKAYTDHRNLVKEGIDAVSIAVPTKLHRNITLDFIRSNVHVLVEKPIATTYSEAVEMAEEAKKFGVILMVGHIERFNPAVQKLKELIDRGMLGRPLVLTARRVGPMPPQIKDVEVTLDLAIHDIDVIRYVTDREIRRVIVKGGSALHPMNYDDYAVVLMELGGGVIGVVEANWLTPYKLRKLYVTGDKAIAELDYMQQTLLIHDKEFAIDVKIEKSEPLKNELKHFLECIIEGKKPLINGEEAANLMKIIEEALNQVRAF
jgi:UDP-N-acetylglucosamine 3-dehydrogenase